MSDEAFIDIVAPDGGTKIAAERYLIGKPSAFEASSWQMNWFSQPIDQALAIVGPGPA
ncbi:hypothetical protein [Bradyrhizobium sp. AUGA SZCCT0431]|uniref:hypothetical protein n=1 Tax=Bradyrhizobium sp. AUGA SZCCT0431 TaxID=2807674 RepID=UPI001BA46CCE|nr:hypothetical protein [Bradyrhizobium sp. AUGA SZCCT0431]MBR1142601.1 hypothetical protein [Bradyrhizobium sp. AUGA SZCCT0431]